MALATQPISPADITQRIATSTNAVRLDVARLQLVTAFLRHKESNPEVLVKFPGPPNRLTGVATP